MKAIDQIRAASTALRRSIVIPEWGNLELWFGRLSVSDMEAVLQREPKNQYERNLILLVSKAQDKDGKPAFEMGHMHFLRTEADFVVLQRVINFMFESAYDLKEAEKIVEENPPSASV